MFRFKSGEVQGAVGNYIACTSILPKRLIILDSLELRAARNIPGNKHDTNYLVEDSALLAKISNGREGKIFARCDCWETSQSCVAPNRLCEYLQSGEKVDGLDLDCQLETLRLGVWKT